jgi:hypothetical protein
VEWSVFKAHVWTKKAALLGSADAQIEALRLLTSVATEQYGTFSMKLAYSPIPEAVVWAGTVGLLRSGVETLGMWNGIRRWRLHFLDSATFVASLLNQT